MFCFLIVAQMESVGLFTFITLAGRLGDGDTPQTNVGCLCTSTLRQHWLVMSAGWPGCNLICNAASFSWRHLWVAAFNLLSRTVFNVVSLSRSAVVVIAASKSEWQGVSHSATSCPITAEHMWTVCSDSYSLSLEATLRRTVETSSFHQNLHFRNLYADDDVLFKHDTALNVLMLGYMCSLLEKKPLMGWGGTWLTVVMDPCHSYMLQVLNCCVLISL